MREPPIRSCLYVPASEERLIHKALASEADAVVLDLEDAVAPNRKLQARENVARTLKQEYGKPIFVRINAPGSELAGLDLEVASGPNLYGLRVPKAESPDAIRELGDWLDLHGRDTKLQLLIESALGVESAFELARSSWRVIGIGLGEADLKADLGVQDDAGLAYARSRIVVASRAAGLSAPIQSVYTNVKDPVGLRESTEVGKRLGFVGRSAIHPAQVAVINEVFTPTDEEMREAETLLARLENAEDVGTGAFALDDGRFVDRAVAESARLMLELAHRKEG